VVSEFIEDVQARFALALQRLGISEQVAGMVSAEFIDDLASAWHGEVYISRRPIEQARIKEEVRRKFNGRNAREVARELEIGRATVYRIIKTSGR
jgi:Mor family transcriptional regulator